MKKEPTNHETITTGDLILRSLNEQQQHAVRTTTGPVLILAGAGSGKTRTLIHRIAYLIAAHHVAPWNILAVTFTNKAAQNMKERMAALLGKELEHQPLMGTFHSVCSKILRREITALGYNNNFVIFNDDDQITLIKKIMKEKGVDTKQVAPRAIQWHISGAKNQLMTPAQFQDTVDDALSELAGEVYPTYQAELKRNNALDFDDLIMKTVEVFQQFPDVLNKYQTLWQHVLVDEYQDTNKAQYVLITLLTKEHNNICVVGDDAQSIYGFRNADIRNILDFEKDYPDATVVLLEQNYRSTQTILDASNAVIAKNKNQKKKKLWTDRNAGEPIVIAEVPNEEAEGEFIIREIVDAQTPATHGAPAADTEVTYVDEDAQPDPEETAIHEGESILDRIMGAKMFHKQHGDHELRTQVQQKKRSIDFSKYVVLYRTNAQSRAIEESFLKYNVPYQLVGGMRFYDRREIKDIVAYLRIILNPSDWVSMERIINVPARGIGPRTWFKIEQFAQQRSFTVIDAAQHDIPDLKNGRVESFYAFTAMVNSIRTDLESLNPTQLLDRLLKEIGYKEHLLATAANGEEGESRWENVQELKTVTQKFHQLRGVEGLQALLEDIALVSDQDELEESDNGVKLMTIHAAKGLEFPTVFVVGMEEGIFPHARSLINPSEMEEERRLCYVAMTRAIDRLYVLFASQRMRYGNVQVNPPSRFIDDIPAELTQWRS